MDMSDEIKAVRIKHLGQCRQPAGHAADAVVAAVFVTIWLTSMVWLMLISFTETWGPHAIRAQAVERGYATHDPVTGKWQWR